MRDDFWHSAKKLALSILFPNRCPFCGRVIDAMKLYCNLCYSNLPFAPYIITPPENVERLLVCCRYCGTARKAVLRYKFGNVIYPAEVFAVMMSERISRMNVTADIITAVPSGKKSVRRRGFSCAEVIAHEISRITGIPFVKALLPTKDKIEQKKLSAKQRAENAKHSFRFNSKTSVLEKSVLLVDDVVTTGSTIKETARILLENGAKEVTACAFAKTFAVSCQNPHSNNLLKKPRGIRLPK